MDEAEVDAWFKEEKEKLVEQFKKNWEFPLKIMLGECSIESFFKMYL